MSLLESIEETKKLLAAAEEKEQKELDAVEDIVEEKVEEIVEEKAEEKVVEEKPVEEKKELVSAEELVAPLKKTHAEYAKERKDRERADKERVQAEIAEYKRQLEETVLNVKGVAQDQEPDPSDEFEHTKWKLRQTEKRLNDISDWKNSFEKKQQRESIESAAEKEFMQHEERYVAVNPDYAQARQAFILAQANAIRLRNPDITQEELVSSVKREALTLASRFANQGYENTAEAIYENMVKIGWQPERKVVEQSKPEPEPPAPKRNLDKVASNRARNSGMAATIVSGETEITRATAANMSSREWMKLDYATKQRLLTQE